MSFTDYNLHETYLDPNVTRSNPRESISRGVKFSKSLNQFNQLLAPCHSINYRSQATGLPINSWRAPTCTVREQSITQYRLSQPGGLAPRSYGR